MEPLPNAFYIQSPRLQTTTQQSARKFCLQSYGLDVTPCNRSKHSTRISAERKSAEAVP